MRYMIAVLLVILMVFWWKEDVRQIRVMPEPTVVKTKISNTPVLENEFFWKSRGDRLRLINNTEIQDFSKKLATNSGCLFGANAYYYDKQNRPLGWLQIDGIQVNKPHKSQLIDGFVYTQDGEFYISQEKPEQAVFGHQSGPMLINNYQQIKSGLDDKIVDRRSVVVQTTDNQAVFLYFPKATLADLGQRIIEVSKVNNFSVKNAINLDGGNSAVIWGEGFHYPETFFAGGFWCRKS